MKKIRLNVADLGATEILSREQLRSVFGGEGSGSGSGEPCAKYYCLKEQLPCCDPYDVCGNSGVCELRPIQH